jgi:omega-amidase
MKDSLHVTTIQANLIWENKVANLKKFDEILRGISPTDIIVLPEMFTTGFSMTPALFVEPLFGDTYHWLLEKSKQHNAAITGSFICAENGQYYNRLLWIQPDGRHYIYDKRHLFSLAGENHHYKEGISRITINWQGWSICPLICYDLRFPVWSRNWQSSPFEYNDDIPQDYYDLLIYVANWPERRNHAWKTLLLARAIENQTFVVGVNRVGNDGNGIYHSGDTSIIDYSGELIQTRADTEGVNVAIFNKVKLSEYRNKFGFLTDKDLFKFNM